MTDLFTLLLVGFVAAATPGPDILLMIRTVIFKSLSNALWVMLGVITGNIIVLSLVYFGLDFLGENFYFKIIVQGIGGVYLISISYKIFLSRNEPLSVKNDKLTVGFKDGLIIHLSNPKAILFFTVIITPFLNGSLLWIKILVLMIGTWSAFLIAIFLGHKLRTKLLNPKIVGKIDLFSAIIFFLFGISMLYNGIKSF